MGGDISVFEQGELEEQFWKFHGPKDESTLQLFRRTFNNLKGTLTQPKRLQYDTDDLLRQSANYSSYYIKEFDVDSDGRRLKCVLWDRGCRSSTCILYLHTNTRASVDATEVLPLCNSINADLLAFDLPGCGQSEGKLSFQMAKDIGNVMNCVLADSIRRDIIIWSRGMSCAPALEWILQRHNFNVRIKYIVLDSPFLSTKAMAQDAVNSCRSRGYFIPGPLVSLCQHYVRSHIKATVGGDLFSIDLTPYASRCNIPCTILSATNDDYIPASHGQALKHMWLGPCEWRSFNSRHFGDREVQLVLSVEPDIKLRLGYHRYSVSDISTLVPSNDGECHEKLNDVSPFIKSKSTYF